MARRKRTFRELIQSSVYYHADLNEAERLRLLRLGSTLRLLGDGDPEIELPKLGMILREANRLARIGHKVKRRNDGNSVRGM